PGERLWRRYQTPEDGSKTPRDEDVPPAGTQRSSRRSSINLRRRRYRGAGRRNQECRTLNRDLVRTFRAGGEFRAIFPRYWRSGAKNRAGAVVPVSLGDVESRSIAESSPENAVPSEPRLSGSG